MQEMVKKKKSPPLAKRVEALEAEVAEFRQQLQRITSAAPGQPDPDWWKHIFGRFKDDPGYDEAVRLGQAYRRRQPKC